MSDAIEEIDEQMAEDEEEAADESPRDVADTGDEIGCTVEGGVVRL